MKKILNFFSIFFLIVIILELISFLLYKSNLLEISHKPKIYLRGNFVTEYNFWTEEKKWGAWRKKNSSLNQKRSCFDVVYKTNEVGARDDKFDIFSLFLK